MQLNFPWKVSVNLLDIFRPFATLFLVEHGWHQGGEFDCCWYWYTHICTFFVFAYVQNGKNQYRHDLHLHLCIWHDIAHVTVFQCGLFLLYEVSLLLKSCSFVSGSWQRHKGIVRLTRAVVVNRRNTPPGKTLHMASSVTVTAET